MNYWINRFESELEVKLARKSTVFVKEKATLLKAFKYFDLDASGIVGFEEWKRAMQKIGIVLPDPQVCCALFQYYDKDGNGFLRYNDFCDQVCGKVLSHSVSGSIVQTPDNVMLKLRAFLLSETELGLLSLAQQFKVLSPKRTFVSISIFSKALFDIGAGLEPDEAVLLFQFFDKDKLGAVDYLRVLQELRGEVTEARKKIVRNTFARISNGGEAIDIKILKKTFVPEEHPAVTSDSKPQDSVLAEFINGFDINHSLWCQNAERLVSKEEFLEYYCFISASIENDSIFFDVLQNCWKPEQKSNTRIKTAYNPRLPNGVPKGFEAVFAKFKQNLVRKGARGMVGIQKVFKDIDRNKNNALNLTDFRRACQLFEMDLGESEVHRIFSGMDRERKGLMDYEEFLRVIRGEMSEGRKRIVVMAWNVLDKEDCGVVDMKEIGLVFDARNHPDVKSGKMSVAEIINEFLETFQTHHITSDISKKNNQITSSEFLSYYETISPTVPNNFDFETILKNAWHLSEPSNKTIQPSPTPSAGKVISNPLPIPPFATSPDKTFYSTSSHPDTQIFKLSMPCSIAAFYRTGSKNFSY